MLAGMRALLAAVHVAALGSAVGIIRAGSSCPSTPECPCEHAH
jgi:hypothetical protein